MISACLLLLLTCASVHLTNAEEAKNYSPPVFGSAFDFETPYIAKCFLTYKNETPSAVDYSVTSIFFRVDDHHNKQNGTLPSSVPIASFTSVGKSVTPAFAITSRIDRLLFSRRLGSIQEVTLLQACTAQGKKTCPPNSVLTANHGRVIELDEQLRRMANEHIDVPFIHPLISKYERENSNHVPRGPKMNSIREIAQVTWPAPLEVVRPCGGNEGKDLLAVVLVFCVVGDINRRMAIRETFGLALKKGSQTEIYFVVGRVEDAA